MKAKWVVPEQVVDRGEDTIEKYKSVESKSITGVKYFVVKRRSGVISCTCPGFVFHGYCKHTKGGK